MGKEVYKFKLQKLLDMRIQKEKEEERLLREEMNLLNKEKDDLRKVKGDIKTYSGIKKDEDLIYQKIKRNYLMALEIKEKEKEKNVKIKEKEVEFRRVNLIQKGKDRKTVEKLKEKEMEEFFKEIERKEAIENDEFALYSFLRNIEGR